MDNTTMIGSVYNQKRHVGREILLSLATLVFSIVFAISNVSGNLRVLDVSHSVSVLSITVMMYNVTYTITSLLWPKVFGGLFSRKTLLLISSLILSLAPLILSITNNLQAIILANMMLGFALALFTPNAITFFIDYTGREHVGITKFNTSSNLGLVIGYFIGGIARSFVDLEELLLTASIINTVSVFAIVLLPERYLLIEPKRITYVSLLPYFIGKLRVLPVIFTTQNMVIDINRFIVSFKKIVYKNLVRKVPLVFIGTLLLFTAIAQYFTPMPAYMRLIGLGDSVLFIMGLFASITSTTCFKIMHKYIMNVETAWRLLIASTTSRIILFLIPLIPLIVVNLPLVSKLLLIALFYLAIGFSWAGISSALTYIVVNIAGPRERSERLGQLNTVIGLGTIIGSFISGIITSALGYEANMATAITMVTIATLLYYRAWKAIID